MINVGVLGFAHGHVMSYGQNWLDHPELGVKITAGWDHDAARCAASCEKLGATVYATPEELLALAKELKIKLSDEELEAVSGGGSWCFDDCSDNVTPMNPM